MIRIRFDPYAARLVRERQWHASQKIKELPKGEIELTFTLSSFAEVVRWILSWEHHARVIASQSLRKEIQKTLKKLGEMYGRV